MNENNYRIILLGDKGRSGQYLPFAKSLVDKLHNQSKIQGNVSLTRKLTLETDITIMVSVINEIKHITINSGVSCPTVIGGVGKNGDIVSIEDPNNPGQFINVYQYLYPSEKTAETYKLNSEYQETELLTTELSTIYGIGSITPKHQSSLVKSSKFTGLMRKFIQLIQGVNGAQHEFDYRFSKTHGIYHNTIKDNYYVIEISPNGIYAIPMRTCSKSKELTPLTYSFPDDKTNAIKLMDSSDITLIEYYNKSPYFSDCGWAFNYSGNQAANCVWDYVGSYKKGYLYKIDISFNDIGVPISATIFKSLEGYMYSPVENSGFWIPNGSGYVDKFNMLTATYSGNQNAPLYCYYKDNDDLEVIRKYWIPNSTEPAYEDMDIYTDYPTTTPWVSYTIMPKFFNVYGKEYKKNSTKTLSYSNKYFTTTTFSTKRNESSSSSAYVTSAKSYQGSSWDGGHTTDDTAPITAGNSSIGNTYAAYKITKTFGNPSLNSESAIVIPSNDRECHMIFNVDRENYSSFACEIYFFPFLYGEKNFMLATKIGDQNSNEYVVSPTSYNGYYGNYTDISNGRDYQLGKETYGLLGIQLSNFTFNATYNPSTGNWTYSIVPTDYGNQWNSWWSSYVLSIRDTVIADMPPGGTIIDRAGDWWGYSKTTATATSKHYLKLYKSNGIQYDLTSWQPLNGGDPTYNQMPFIADVISDATNNTNTVIKYKGNNLVNLATYYVNDGSTNLSFIGRT